MQVKILARTVITVGRANPWQSIIAPPLQQKPTSQQYGTAKKATLVVVKMSRLSLTESATVFDSILQHTLSKKRQKHSVITMSWGGTEFSDPNYLTLYGNQRRISIGKLFRNDVKVAVSAEKYVKSTDPGTGDLRKTVDNSFRISNR